MDTSDARKQAVKADFIARRGYWAPWHEGLLGLNPDFLEAYLDMTSLAWTDGVLEPKVKEFIYIAIDAATTHLYLRGLRLHIGTALKYGATQAEIMEVLQIVSQLGWHTCSVGVPILADELRKAGLGDQIDAPLAPNAIELKKKFEKDLGYWDDCCAGPHRTRVPRGVLPVFGTSVDVVRAGAQGQGVHCAVSQRLHHPPARSRHAHAYPPRYRLWRDASRDHGSPATHQRAGHPYLLDRCADIHGRAGTRRNFSGVTRAAIAHLIRNPCRPCVTSIHVTLNAT